MSTCLACLREVPMADIVLGHCPPCRELHLHQVDGDSPFDGRPVVEVEVRCGLL